MKNILQMLVLCLLVIFSFSCQKNTSSEPLINLLTNGNIENDVFTWKVFFSPQSNPNTSIVESTEEFSFSPKKSLKISCPKVNDNAAFSYFVQDISAANLKAGSKLTLTAKVRGVNLIGNGVSIALRGDATTGAAGTRFFKTTQDITPLRGTFDFREVTLSLDSYEGNADRIIVFLLLLPNTIGTVYFDDISLTSN